MATAALFSVDLNTKNICPNPWGQSAHITKFPLAGISGCPSVDLEPLRGWGRGHRERKCPRTHFRETSELHLPHWLEKACWFKAFKTKNGMTPLF